MDVINEIDERTKFEDFPPEIFHMIFDYLTGDNVFKSFLYLNTRFNHLIENLRLNTIDLSEWTRREITDLFKTSFDYISKYSQSLKLTNHIIQSDSCSANIEFIFSSLIDYYQLTFLLNNLQQLIFLRPIIDPIICLPDRILQSFLIYLSNNQIILKKKNPQHRLESLMICSNEILRSLLTDNGEISNQLLISFQNPLIDTIIPYVRHLKLNLDNYNHQWHRISSLIGNTISELTLLIFDNKFEYYDGQLFSSLFKNLSDHCHLHFYLQFIPNQIHTRREIDLLFQSFQTDFYIQHQVNITIAYCRNFQTTIECPLIIYTSPFCASKLTLINNQERIGICSDYRNLTRLILDPCFRNYMNIFHPHNQLEMFSNLTSLEFLDTTSYYFNQMVNSLNTIFQQISSRLRHIHFRNVQGSAFLIKNILSLYHFQSLRYLDITDSEENCSILSDILRQKNFCLNIFHLNISGLCRLKIHHMKEISMTFSHLQTLKFSMKFNSSFHEQLDTIGEFILIEMSSHLHYVHIYFQQENLLIMSLTPSESQLSEWLGYNQKRLGHVQAIELNRNELSAWM